VGESTIQYFNNFIKFLDLKDEEWMPQCNATYKGAIKFTNFNQCNHYYAPFKDITQIDQKTLQDWSVISSVDKNLSPDYFGKYVWPGTHLLDENKFTDYDSQLDFNLKDNSSYNLDANLFGVYLREEYCKPKGVVHVVDTIKNVVKDNHGFVTAIEGNNGVYHADLYIDCTGFKSLLLEKTMNVPFKKYDELFNDRAVVFNSIEYEDKDKELEGYTNTIAKDYGWIWNIPLWNRISNGYVYSSKFTTDEQALQHLTDHVTSIRGLERAKKQKPFYVDIKNGRHEKSWVKNVVGIGLSFGFIEPLGSTGLLLTQRGIIRLVTLLNSRNFDFNTFDTENFNHFYNDTIDSLKDFYLVHFLTTQREDTDYWKHIKYNIQPDSDSFKRVQSIVAYTLHDNSSYSPINIFHWQLYGMGYNGYNIEMVKHLIENGDMVRYGKEEAIKFWKKDTKIKDHVAKLPTLYQFLAKNIYKTH
jgi:tryptophan halogenase